MNIYFSNIGLLRRRTLRRVAEVALKHLNQPSDKLEMSLSFVSPDEIRSLNRQFRDVDSVTDVLSFPTFDAARAVVDVSQGNADVDPTTGRINLGDVIICRERAEQQAREYGHGLKREMCFLTIHGLLHLLGYDHMTSDDEAQMFALQDEILTKANILR